MSNQSVTTVAMVVVMVLVVIPGYLAGLCEVVCNNQTAYNQAMVENCTWYVEIVRVPEDLKCLIEQTIAVPPGKGREMETSSTLRGRTETQPGPEVIRDQ